MEIAVLVNYEGKTSLFTENGTIKVFLKDAPGWNLVREKEYIVEDLSDGNELRNCLGDVGVWLNDCKILIVKRILGIHYLALERFHLTGLVRDFSPVPCLSFLAICIRMEYNLIN